MRAHSMFALFLLLVLSSPALAEGDAEQGKTAFDETKCITCHSVGDQAGPMAQLGGSLDGIGSRHDAAWLTSFLTDSTSVKPDAKPHPGKVDAAKIPDLVAFLLTLTGADSDTAE